MLSYRGSVRGAALSAVRLGRHHSVTGWRQRSRCHWTLERATRAKTRMGATRPPRMCHGLTPTTMRNDLLEYRTLKACGPAVFPTQIVSILSHALPVGARTFFEILLRCECPTRHESAENPTFGAAGAAGRAAHLEARRAGRAGRW